jgi:predicted nucleic acid-binding protein
MKPRRYILDTNILDKIAEEDQMVALVRDHTDRGELDLVVTSVTEREVGLISDRVKQKRITAIPRRMIGTTGFVLDYSRLDVDRLGPEGPIEAIRQGRLKETLDALIAATAKSEGLLFVTEDVRLRKKVEDELKLVVWGWHQLRTDLMQLACAPGAALS